MDTEPSFGKRVRKIVVGSARNLDDRSLFHAISLTAFLAWVGMGADGLSSSCYGPEEAFLALKGHSYLAILVGLGSALTVLIISFSYSQIIELFPTGGGGYLVASKMLNPWLGMVSGCALLIDYMLTIALSVASGAAALFSFLPVEWQSYRLAFALLGVIGLTVMNLRGIKESVAPLIPIILAFALTHGFLIVYALAVHIPNIPTIVETTARDFSAARSEIGLAAVFMLLLRSYSMGAGTYTGIEAVSNGLPVIREPKVVNGKRTMKYMAFSLAFMVTGLMIAYLLFHVEPQPGKTLNAVLFDTVTQNWGITGRILTMVALVSAAALLFVAAQTGFLDGPRVLANMALDRWFPTRFSMLSDRLVTQNGILLMGTAAFLLVLLTRGSVVFLVVLYSITVFITFCLSQLGMVRHWWKERRTAKGWRHRLAINGIGLVLTSFILLSMAIVKFHEGGWLTLLVTAVLILVAVMVRRHYRATSRQLGRLDDLVKTALAREEEGPIKSGPVEPAKGPHAGTAILLVNGFNGLGLHTLLNCIRLFPGHFKNFVFLQVGVVDVGTFKGSAEMERLREHLDHDGAKYVSFVRRHGFYGEQIGLVGVDVVEELDRAVPEVLARFPGAILFGGQLVFERETFLTRILHNQTIFSVQKRLYHRGIPILILPIRV
ncbi:amino acid transporter [candidate division GN15 bacterium]|uniref:Amino acid transporter n=1 Tax=candidate division GN15 bacterium TaxID=2072418 RepID=A0A855X9D8_9BACT|nr:MAG: amino acid transporter [candidate division GN15 bacterium]